MILTIHYQNGEAEALEVLRAKVKDYKLFIQKENGDKEKIDILSLEESELITHLYVGDHLMFHIYDLKWENNIKAMGELE